jgi:hypothetical protein
MSCQPLDCWGSSTARSSQDKLTLIAFWSSGRWCGIEWRWRIIKQSDSIRCRWTMDLGRHVSRDSSRTDENGSSARAFKIVASIGLVFVNSASAVSLDSVLQISLDEGIKSQSNMQGPQGWACPKVHERSSWLIVLSWRDTGRLIADQWQRFSLSLSRMSYFWGKRIETFHVRFHQDFRLSQLS